MSINKYGLTWANEYEPLDIEFHCIRKGAAWCAKNGTTLFDHYKAAQMILWPDDHYHRWSDIILKSIVENQVTVLAGSSDSGKTYQMSKFGLVDFFASPSNTLTIVSSTDSRGLELRIWGKMKELFNRAKDVRDDLPGNVIDYMKCITPDEVDDSGNRARTINKGIICVPCVQGSNNVGLGKYIGIKPPNSPGKQDGRLRHLGDEVSAMRETFLDAYSNWIGKSDFKGVMSGNFIDTLDPLGKAAEPKCGWDAHSEPTKTTTWRSRFYDALVVNLVGTDSPNFDYDRNQPPRYPELISWVKIDAVAATWGKNSVQYYSQCVGVMKPGFDGNRVITRDLCKNNQAMDGVVWDGSERTQIYAIDPAYGGGDRCTAIHLEFGVSSEGVQTILTHAPKVIPINVNLPESPEEQIAKFVYLDTQNLGIPSENIFYDAFGKGTVGFAFAKVFGVNPPVPVESGGKPSDRPVRHDLFVNERGSQRLKRCDEHYQKRISELWFSSRYVIECGQMRGLTQSVIDEGCLRYYMVVNGGKLEVESKIDMKQRIGRSPDEFDVLCIGIEGCRQRGFKIRRLNEDAQGSKPNQLLDWYLKGQKKAQQDRTRYALKAV